MADFSMVGGGPSAFDDSFVLANTAGTNVTASGTADTKGSYVELVSAANNTTATRYLSIQFSGKAALAEFLVDIAVGGAGSEEVVIDNIWVFDSTASATMIFALPYNIASGQRISARCQSNVSSGVITVLVSRQAGVFSQTPGLGEVTTYGANTTTTSGVQVARAGAAAWGSWVEMTASTTDAAKGFLVACHKEGLASWTTLQLVFQVAVGSAGNEEIISPTFTVTTNSNETMMPGITQFIEAGIASGQRVSIRASGSASNGDLDLHYVLYLVR